MFKKLTCCLLCVLLAAMPLLGLAEESFTMVGFDGEDSTHDWSTNRFFVRMQERTGIIAGGKLWSMVGGVVSGARLSSAEMLSKASSDAVEASFAASPQAHKSRAHAKNKYNNFFITQTPP